MRLGRSKPPADCKDLGLWLSETVNDAMRDCTERGLSELEAATIVLSLGGSRASGLKLDAIVRIVGRSRGGRHGL